MKSMDKEKFSYFRFLFNRFIRLLPIVILATTLCLVTGYFAMLPDDFENLCETIVATNIFANNVLQCITTSNYWDVVNEYKPLMHTWYLGILVQSYLVLPWIFMIAKKINREKYKWTAVKISLAVLVASFTMYLLPFFSEAEKFYYLPFRLFEVTAGVMAACAIETGVSFLKVSWFSKIKYILGMAVAGIGILVILSANEMSAELIYVCVFSVIMIQYIVVCWNDEFLLRGGANY